MVTADHGISFHADLSRRIVVPGNVGDIANVPMFVKKPKQRSGRVNDEAARTIDILPTVAEAAGVRLDGEVDGGPLDALGSRDDSVRVSSYTGTPVEISFAGFVRRRDAEVRRRLRLFGSGGFETSSPPGRSRAWSGASSRPFRPGPAAFRHSSTRSGLASFSPGSATVPAFVTGRLSGSVVGGELVAIALNGRIAAVTKSYRDGVARCDDLARLPATGCQQGRGAGGTGTPSRCACPRRRTGSENASSVRDGKKLVR